MGIGQDWIQAVHLSRELKMKKALGAPQSELDKIRKKMKQKVGDVVENAI